MKKFFSNLTKKQKKILKSIIICLPLLIICKLIPFDSFGKYKLLAETACYMVPYLIVGFSTLKKAVQGIISGHMFDENFLMAVATVGAFALGEASEAVFVVLFYRIGVLFESIATEKSRKSIKGLMDIMPDSANVERDGKLCRVDPSQVKSGEIIVVKPGEKVPLDGTVLDGSSTLNTAALTGESLPLNITAGDKVISGAINEEGVLRIVTESEYENSTVGKILALVENSAAKKAKTEKFITRFAAIYTPAVVVSAVVLGLFPPLFGLGSFAMWINRALTFLVISCPCALVISVPLSFFGGMGSASKRGILIKGAVYLENLNKMKTCLFDKTGTLTKGCFKVTAIHPERITESELLRIAAAAEGYSNHPISVSLVTAYGKVPDIKAENVEEIPGAGVHAVIDGKMVLVGNERLMSQAGISFCECHLHPAGTMIHIAVDSEYMGHIVISDEVKDNSAKTIRELKSLGIHTVMLTGDNKKIADSVAGQLGVDEVHAGLLPDGKVEFARERMKQDGSDEVVGFVGDGINDAPVLMCADVGISMGAMGSDAAIEAADIVIMDDSIEKIVVARRIAKKTMQIVRQNIIFSLAVKLVVLILGAFGYAPMWLAIFADVGVSVIAILNAARAMFLGQKF